MLNTRSDQDHSDDCSTHPEPPRAQAPIGAFMRVGDSFRLALEIAQVAISVAEQAGADERHLASLRRQIHALRCAP